MLWECGSSSFSSNASPLPSPPAERAFLKSRWLLFFIFGGLFSSSGLRCSGKGVERFFPLALLFCFVKGVCCCDAFLLFAKLKRKSLSPRPANRKRLIIVINRYKTERDLGDIDLSLIREQYPIWNEVPYLFNILLFCCTPVMRLLYALFLFLPSAKQR